jgi:hypothetical protein
MEAMDESDIPLQTIRHRDEQHPKKSIATAHWSKFKSKQASPGNQNEETHDRF